MGAERFLLCRAAGRLVALPVTTGHARLLETMRPLPVRPLPGLPAHVAGAAMIRGAAVPVLDVRRLLGEPAGAPARFVTLELTGGRVVALAVDAVLDVRAVDGGDAVPPLLAAVDAPLVSALGASDGELLHVLDAAHVLDDDAAWAALS